MDHPKERLARIQQSVKVQDELTTRHLQPKNKLRHLAQYREAPGERNHR